MDIFSKHDFPNLEMIPHGSDSWVCDTDNRMMEVSPLEGFSEGDWTEEFPYSSNQLFLNDIENFKFDFEVPVIGEDLDQKPLNNVVPEKKEEVVKKRSSALGFDEIKKHFDVPIAEAAKQMKVGLTLLKRRCRELNIMRWPHRKLKSLMLLIDNVKEMGLANEVAMLEKHKTMLEKLPGLELSEETKKLRQACFKANYKRRRYYLALQP